LPESSVLKSRLRLTPTRALTLAIPLFYVLIFAAFVLRKGDTDWDQMLAFHRLSLWNSKMFGWEKHWNPLMSGGMSLAGDPQVPIFSPSMLLAHVMPTAAAMKAAALLFLAAGWAGAYLLAGQLGLGPATAALAASLFAGNGFILSRLSHGHVDFLGTLTLPLWLWASRVVVREPDEPQGRAARRLAAAVLGGGLLFALSTDGAPITILLLLVWVGLDAAVLAWQRRSARPLVFFAGSLVTAGFLNAIYYLPLVTNAVDFPRTRAAVFLDPLLFFWFLLLPVRGKVLPAPANGHEFSVYIGPVLAYLIVRYRREVARAFGREARWRFLVLSAATFVIGLGAWKALADWLPPGPFDLLHQLPGFESVGIPGRFWGYLALPLALAAAVALQALEEDTCPAHPRRLLWTGVFVFTLAFQATSLAEPFLSQKGRRHLRAAKLPAEIHRIENVGGPVSSQSQQMTPTRGLIQAYNNHDYVHGTIAPGAELVRQTRWTRGGPPLNARAEWDGWNKIVVTLPDGGGPGAVIFNQNFHSLWRSSAAAVTRNRRGNLALRLAQPVPPGTTITLRFRDENSILGKKISRIAAYLFLAAAAVVGALVFADRRRARATRGREPERQLSRVS
jgi:hypothetical protein